MLSRSATASPSIHDFHYAPVHSPRQSPSRTPAAAAAASTATAAAARRPSSVSSPGVPALTSPLSQTLAALPLSSPQSLLPLASQRAPTSSQSSQPLPPPQVPPQHRQQQQQQQQQQSAAGPTTSPSPSRPSERRPHAYADAATQYSPMEPFDYAAHPQRYPTSTSKQSTPRELPPTPGPVPMEPGIEQGVDHGQQQGAGSSNTTSNANNDSNQTAPGQTDPSSSRPPPGGPTAPAPAAATGAPTTRDNGHPPSVTTPTTSSSSAQGQQLQSSSSPAKRRGSQGPGGQDDGPSGEPSDVPPGSSSVVHSPSSGSKRVRSEAGPPKILPERYELCAVEDMVVLIANMLGELIETNDGLALKSGHLTRFHSRTAPGISVLDYLHRLAKHATLTPPLLLSMVYYIDRLCAMYPDFTINTLTVHRFLITAATVAAKGLSDSFWNNSTYARVGGVRVAELKMLELEFLYRLEWKIVPNPEVLAAYYRPLVERCPGYILPSDNSSSAAQSSANDDDEVLDDVDDGNDESVNESATRNAAAATANTTIPTTTNNHTGGSGDVPQSSTSLIDRDMVVSGPGRVTSQK